MEKFLVMPLRRRMGAGRNAAAIDYRYRCEPGSSKPAQNNMRYIREEFLAGKPAESECALL